MVLYRFLISIFVLMSGLKLVFRGAGAGLWERFGRTAPAQHRPHVWLHAASNGELASARPVIEALRAARPDLALLVTCNSASGVALAQDWGLAAQLAPFDLGWVMRRFQRRWGVVAQITMEAEVWPNRVLLCPGPVIVLGARLTAGTARMWTRLGGTAQRVLGKVTLLSAQDAASAERFRALGLPASALGPVVDLKALYAPPADLTPDADVRQSFERSATWLAASTHDGEEDVIIAAHLAARQSWPELRLILAPRHPRRADEVAAALRGAGLGFARRALGETGAEVLLADTLGEMALWYQLAGIVFVGGTLTDRGGHTPYEPAAFGAALLHGPDVANFTQAYARLQAAGAATCVRDADSLAAALLALRDPQHQRDRGRAAQDALTQDADLGALMARLLPLLPPA